MRYICMRLSVCSPILACLLPTFIFQNFISTVWEQRGSEASRARASSSLHKRHCPRCGNSGLHNTWRENDYREGCVKLAPLRCAGTCCHPVHKPLIWQGGCSIVSRLLLLIGCLYAEEQTKRAVSWNPFGAIDKRKLFEAESPPRNRSI